MIIFCTCFSCTLIERLVLSQENYRGRFLISHWFYSSTLRDLLVWSSLGMFVNQLLIEDGLWMMVDKIWKLTNTVRVGLNPRSSHYEYLTTFCFCSNFCEFVIFCVFVNFLWYRVYWTVFRGETNCWQEQNKDWTKCSPRWQYTKTYISR